MKKNIIWRIFIFLLLQGIFLRILNMGITPWLQSLYLDGLSINYIFYFRVLIEIVTASISFFIFFRYNKIFFASNLQTIKFCSRCIACYIIALIILLKFSQGLPTIPHWIWVLCLPVEGYLCLAFLFSGSYGLQNAPTLSFLPSIFASYLFYLLSLKKEK